MGDVIPFPPTPRRSDGKGYWHCAGSIFHNAGGRGVYLTPAEAADRRDLYMAEASRHGFDISTGDARIAARRWLELDRALCELADFNRMVGRVVS